MPGCASRCTNYRKDTIINAWTDIRGYYGPMNTDIYNQDIAEWETWAISKSKNTNDVVLFGKWLIWRITMRTVNYGNLPTRGTHKGIYGITCPYDSNSSVLRTRLMLGLSDADPLPIRVDHGDSYMRVSNRLSAWGPECTFLGCTYYINNGKYYFYT